VAERHVHEHDLPQPARLRHQFARRGRDQPVDQDDGPIGDRLHRARQRGRPGHRVFVHIPAERGKPIADPPVVCVPAARPSRIVDALRDDEVDVRHSVRS
jgi:hypothetical protein